MIRELIDTDLEVVAGGNGPFDLSFINVDQDFKATNKADQYALSFGGSSLNVLGSQSITGGNSAVIVR
jgi:hypothetical protein